MKKLIFTLTLSLFGIFIFAQQVPRDKVIVEIGTGTWCTYCPGAAMGADDLVANGCEVGIIEYHNGDSFTNPASDARISYYGISGFPTAFFDGVLSYVGGSHTASMYSNYLPLYNQRIAIPSSFTIGINGENTGSTYNIVLTLHQAASTSSTNIKAHLVLTESDIVFSWQGQSELNFVERTMVPDQNGTSVDFSSTDDITLELSFTMDASWVSSNCELVAFLQDNDTKEVLQGTMVPLPDLQPLQATAGFSASTELPCMNSSVQYTDESGGNIVSWNWTFEGGDPATSTDQNPTVNYNALGSYNVQQIVYDGEVYDTLLRTQYITVITNPEQPDMPTGNDELCEGDATETYTTPAVDWATSYIWQVTPSNAGTISGTGTTGTFELNSNFLGDFNVSVRADNGCGQGTWSDAMPATVYHSPVDYTLSEGGGYCEGDPGIDLTLDGSEVGMNYELYIDGDPTGQILAGDGSPLDFGFQTEQGIYTCLGSSDHCSNQMIGNSYIFQTTPPVPPAAAQGSTEECNSSDSTTYVTAGSPNATAYNWTLTPEEAGTISGITEVAVVDWDPSFTGTAQVSVQAENACGLSNSSDPLDVTVYAIPAPAISGDDQVCDGDAGVIYSTPMNTGSSYVWEITGGTITSGMGTNEVMVTWGTPGNGSLMVTETSEPGCVGTSENFGVVIDDCTGLDEISTGSLRVYPNPVKDRLTLDFAAENGSEYNVLITDHLGKVVYSGSQNVLSTSDHLTINTSQLPEGIYSVRISNDKGFDVVKKFVKMN
jgi:PKD repeat protein